MIETKDVNREALLSAISHAFFLLLRARMEDDIARGVDPEATGNINIEIVLDGLELAKEALATHFQCRPNFLFARARPKEGTSWATLASEKHGWKMVEYLLDFSISLGPIPVAIGDWAGPKFEEGEKFELLLGAESEMNSDMEVARDLLKLLDTRCRVKVLLFEARKDAGNLKNKLEQVFRIHASQPTDDIWLVMGIPNYATWHAHKGNLHSMPRQIYTLARNGSTLEERAAFWPF
jgi:hypothetical protein